MLTMIKYTKGTTDLRRYHLTSDEWDLLEQLYGVLGVRHSFHACDMMLIGPLELPQGYGACLQVRRSAST